MKRLSIGARLTMWYLLVFALAQCLFGFGMWFILRHSLYEIGDRDLTNQADDLRHFLEAQKKDASIAKLQEEITEIYVLEHSGDYLQIYVPPEEWIYRSSFMQTMSFLPAQDPLLQPVVLDRQLGGKPFRFLSQRIDVHGRRFVAQMGAPTDNVVQTLALFRRYLLMFAPVIFLTASGVGYLISRRALSPVDTLTRTARTISGSNLSRRLERLHTGDELQRLSETLNEMLNRIETAFLRVTQFTADASHELRTPLSLIRTEAEIALRKSRTEDEYRDALVHILKESETIAAMIEQLLSLARADSGQNVLQMQRIDLREVVLRATSEWQTFAGSNDLVFTETVPTRDFGIAGDKSAVRQLLNILLDNAFKYTPRPGRICLSLEKKGDRVVLKVADTGIGIALEDQARIFERFYRADPARNRELAGAGLGLAIAFWIVQQHHGSIEVNSTPGNGSTFVVELPLHSTAASNLAS